MIPRLRHLLPALMLSALVMAPAAAELLAALMLGEVPLIDPVPYALTQR